MQYIYEYNYKQHQNYQSIISLYIFQLDSPQTKMLNQYKRYKSSNLSQSSLHPKLFHRKDLDPKGEDLYEQSIEDIIKLRKFLGLTQLTILIAIDLYKNFLKSVGWQFRTDKVAAYMASIFLASKLNQIYPPKMEAIVQACQNLADKNKILQMQKIIWKLSYFVIPLNNNLSFCFEEILGNKNIKKIQQCIKQALKCLSDPILMQHDNMTIAKAIVEILFPQTTGIKKIDKDLIRIIFRLKRRLKIEFIPLS